MKEMQSILTPVLGLVLLVYGVSLIDSARGEVCFQDANCTTGGFCNFSAQQAYKQNPSSRKLPFGKITVAGVCSKCIDCAALYRKTKSAKIQQCIKNITECGICLDEHEPIFSHAGYHVECKPKNQINGFNESALNSSRLQEEQDTEVDDGSLKTAGTIVGGVAMGLVAIAAIAFFGIFGYRHYKGRKEKRNTKVEDAENATTTELQELKPVTLPSIKDYAKVQDQPEDS